MAWEEQKASPGQSSEHYQIKRTSPKTTVKLNPSQEGHGYFRIKVTSKRKHQHMVDWIEEAKSL